MTEITVRQRNQVTIPKAIAEAAGIEEGTVCDMQYANGVITITACPSTDRRSTSCSSPAAVSGRMGKHAGGHRPEHPGDSRLRSTAT